jgi:hypothetical protein
MYKIGTLAIALLATSSAAAFAGRVDDRREHQFYKIEEGRQDGSITWTEGLKLRGEQKKISKVESILKSDGYLSRKDRRILNKMQNKAAYDIGSQSNDRWQRVWWMPRFGR